MNKTWWYIVEPWYDENRKRRGKTLYLEAKQLTKKGKGNAVYKVRVLCQLRCRSYQIKNIRRRNCTDVNRNVNKFHVLNSLTCFYTNAAQFRNKFSEFQTRITNYSPMILGITETCIIKWTRQSSIWTMLLIMICFQ